VTPQLAVFRVNKFWLSLVVLVSLFLLMMAVSGDATLAQTGDIPQTGPVFTVNTTAHPGDGVCTTANCTLAEAVTAANTTPNGAQPDEIHFNIAGCADGRCRIVLESPLSDVVESVVIDALTQPGMNGTCSLNVGVPLGIDLDGYWSMSSDPVDMYSAFNITGGSVTIRGFNMTNFGAEVIRLQSNNNRIECNHFGPTGEVTYYNRNRTVGIRINGSNNVIGGPGLGNVIVHSRRDGGILIEGASAQGNIIQANRIGLTLADGCGYNDGTGIRITDSSANLIGGTRPELRNVISCNDNGITIWGDQALHNVIQGNYIGLNASGNAARLNGHSAIEINSLTKTNIGTLIGGDAVDARNIIAAHQETIMIYGTSPVVPATTTPTRIVGNFLGVNTAGNDRVGSGNRGITLADVENVEVSHNVVSGSFFNALYVFGAKDFTIRGNIIGADASGSAPIGNSTGIYVVTPEFSEEPLGVIGGNDPGDANVIRFNNTGIRVAGTATRILRNIVSDNPYGGITPESERLSVLRYRLRIMRVSNSEIQVRLTDMPNTAYRVEVFANSVCSPLGSGEGQTFVGFVDFTTDEAGLGSGTLSYTPVSGQNVFAATVTVEDTYSSGFSECFTYTPTADITATPFGLIIGRESVWGESRVGMNYQQRYTATSPFIPVSLTVDAATLPPGLTFANNMLTGVPTEAGTFAVTFQARDALNHTVVQTFYVSVSPAYVITPETLAGGRVNNRYEQLFEILNGYRSDFRLRVIDGNLPPGVTYQNFGLDGSPTQAGTFTFTLGWGEPSHTFIVYAQRTYTVTILENPVIIEPETLPVIDFNVFYDQLITVDGGTAPYSLSMTSGRLPPGITFDAASGRITGRVQGYAYEVVTIRATDATGIYNERSYILTVANMPTGTWIPVTPTSTPPPTATATPTTPYLVPDILPNAQINVAYSQQLRVMPPPFGGGGGGGGNDKASVPTFGIASGQLPSGITLSTSGLLSGIPTTLGSYEFIVQVTGTVSVSRTYTLVVQTDPVPTPTPNYMTLTAMPTLTPTATSTPTPTPTALPSPSITPSVTPLPLPLALTTLSLPNGTVGLTYSQAIGVMGGRPPYTFSVQRGALPMGLTLSMTGILSGIPAAAGSTTFTLQVTDAVGTVAAQAYTLVIGPVVAQTLILAPSSLPNAYVNVGYQAIIGAQGGSGLYTYLIIAGQLPPGMSMNGATGIISGVPTVLGSYTFTVQAFDNADATGLTIGTATFVLTVAPPDTLGSN